MLEKVHKQMLVKKKKRRNTSKCV